MKKIFMLVVMAAVLSSCGKTELEDAENTLMEMREKESQPADWKIFNSKITGVKTDDGQGQQSGGSASSDKPKEQQQGGSSTNQK